MLKSRVLKAFAVAALFTTALAGPVDAASDKSAFRMIVGEPRYMDPNLAADFAIYVNAQLFQPLARTDKDGNLVLLQAKSIELAPDGRTWKIALNPDYKWSNGQPVTAADWVYSWKRILDPKTGSETASFLSDVENAMDYNKGTLTDAEKVGIKATGEYSFEVVTALPAPQFRAKLALPYLTPVPKAVVARAHALQRSLQAREPRQRSVDRDGGQSALWRCKARDSAHRDDDRVGRSMHRAITRL
jgi:oligopeptide transport system substrate-binding protein